MTIEAAIKDLQDKALSLPGMKAAPDTATENMSVYPFAISYERSGELQLRSAGWGEDLAVIVTEFHVSRQLLNKAIETAMKLRDPFLKLILGDPKLGNTVETVTTMSRTFGLLNYGGVESIGYRFETGVKVYLAST